MANRQDDNEAKLDSFEIDDSGEAPNYISLDQARILAMQVASNEPGNYGQSLAGINMAFEVVSQEETEDYYAVTLSFRPEGNFKGTPGEEQFFIEKVGEVAYRQVLALPRIGQRRKGRVLTLVAIIGTLILGVILAVLFAGGLLGSDSGGDNVASANPPTTRSLIGSTSQPPNTPIPLLAVTGLVPTSTPEPTPTVTAVSKIVPALMTEPANHSSATPSIVPTPSPTAIPHPYGQPILGVQLKYLTPDLVSNYGLQVLRGAMVTEVRPGTAAAALGLKERDVITRLNNRPVDSNELWNRAFEDLEAGGTVHIDYVVYVRSSNPGSIVFGKDVTLGAHYTVRVSRNPGITLNYFLEKGQSMEFHMLDAGNFTLGILDPDGSPLSFAISAGRVTASKSGTYQFIIKTTGRLMGLRTREVDWYYRISGTR